MPSISTAGAAAQDPETDYTEKLIRGVHAEIAVDPKLLSAARWRRNEVTAAGRDFDGIRDSYNSGSVAHGTVIRQVEDADAGVVLDGRKFRELGPDGQGPVDIVNVVAAFIGEKLAHKHPRLEVEVEPKRAIKFTFNVPVQRQDPYVHLIVALERRDGKGLWIPRLRDNTWDASHPEGHTQLLAGQDLAKDLRVYRARLIRLGKAFLQQDEQPALSSFHFSALTLMFIDGPMSTLVEGLQRVLEHGAADLARQDTPDPAHVSDPIKLDVPRAHATARLEGAARNLTQAIANRHDARAAQEALHLVFPDYIPAPSGSGKFGHAERLRRSRPGLGSAAAVGPATASKTPRSSGDAAQ